MYALDYDDRFLRHLSALSSTEQRQAEKALRLLEANPNHPSLRSKRIRSKEGVFECSVNMDVRITWRYKGKGVIVLTDIGHHGILDRF